MNQGISVIIPTFNREKMVTKAIQSVLDQDYDGKIEIIISDDGSTDSTLKVANSFGEKVVILEKPKKCKSQGASGARNRGIMASTQPFICFLDSDDFYLPGHLKRMSKSLQSNRELGFVFCKILELKEENNQSLYRPWTANKIFRMDVKNLVLSRNNIVHTNSFLFRREVFNEVGVFNENYSNGEDGDLWMRINERYEGKFANYFGVVYRTHYSENQLTNNSNKKIKKCYLDIFQNAEKRYHDLQLKSSFRLYKIKERSLRAYSLKKSHYRIRYIKLALQFPISHLKSKFYNSRFFNKQNSWTSLQRYLL